MDEYKIIIEQEKSTVVARYERQAQEQSAYQGEEALEKAFIARLAGMNYEYLAIKDEAALLHNLRQQLEALNKLEFSDAEWAQLLKQLANENLSVADKTEIIQKNHILNITLDNGVTKNVKLIDKVNIHNNKLQVINQYEVEGAHKNRYDVTILVNGLPLVHVELKRRGVNIKEAFNQIERYQRDSFWSGCGLHDYVQLFVISNGSETKYYSNSTRYDHVEEVRKQQRKKKTDGASFEFTSWWSDQKNKNIPELMDFTTHFLNKNTLLNILTKYCVFNSERKLMVMRPYQIAATEAILLRIRRAINLRQQGKRDAGGYIWHTTGSGKTLTSFKTAQLATQIEGVEKVLFVVDRQDLDYQTMKEYDHFEPNAANSNANSAILLRQLKDPQAKIIITTIQKLSNLLKKRNDELEILEKNVVIVFDECHRSNFGDMHVLIEKKFKKYIMFGFTGTPIFTKNANGAKKNKYHTTEEAFGERLHTYTIINAIHDKNVLKFKVDYESTMRMKDEVDSKLVWGIETDEALHDPRRVEIITRYILDRFGEKTKQKGEVYAMSKLTNISEVVKKGKDATEERVRVKTRGFNSILATDSVQSAIAYYEEFKKQQQELPQSQRLKIATIFTYAVNEEEDTNGLPGDEDPESTNQLPQQSRDALDAAIRDYNALYGTNFSTDGDKFQNYYKDVSLRMKNKEIDVLIVVGMFLTGFDAKTLNTLWVDKNLKLHGLLQAFSRTNRILNAVKDAGNIVCFRNLEQATDESLALFGDEDARGIVLMKTFEEYYSKGWEDEKGEYQEPYKDLIARLLALYPIGRIPDIVSEEEKKAFVRLFGAVLQMQNILDTFDDFTPDKHGISEFAMQDYLSWYNTLHEEFKKGQRGDKENINDDIVFEMELVRQIQVNIDYILMLVEKYHKDNCHDAELVVRIAKAIESSPDLRDKKELIEDFITSMTPDDDTYAEWQRYVARRREEDLNAIIAEENLKPEATRKFIEKAFGDGFVAEMGVAVAKILPPMPLFSKEVNRAEKKRIVLDKLKTYFEKYKDIV